MSGSKLLLLHGALGAAQQMEPLAELLDANAICFDLPGHGAKAQDDAPFEIERMALCVGELIKEPTDLVGYSMGGYVALYLAATRPDKVKSVVTLATKFNWTPEGAAHEVRVMNAEKIKEKVPAFAALLEKRHGNHWPNVMKKTANMMLALGQHPSLTVALLNAIECPVLLLRGTEDTMVSKEETLWAQSQIRNARFAELERQPHPFEKVDLNILIEALQRV